MQAWYDDAQSYLLTSTFSKAIEAMLPLAQSLEQWSLCDRLHAYDTQLHYMMDYLRRGAEDPTRKESYLGLEEKLWCLLKQLGALLDIKQKCPCYDAQVKRWNGHHGVDTLQELLSDLRRGHALLSALSPQADPVQARQLIELHAQRQRDLFYYHLTRLSWQSDEQQLMLQALQGEEEGLPDDELCLALSAVTLSLLMYADPVKLDWLVSAYQYGRSWSVKARALVGIVFVYSGEESLTDRYPEVVSHLQALVDDTRLTTHLRQTILQIHCQYQTKTTQKRLRDTILPDLVKFGGIHLNPGEGEKEEPTFDPGANRQMEERVERMEKHMKELMKRTKRGEDIQYTSFMQTKQHAFFQEMAHWFLPFHRLHPTVVGLYGLPQSRPDSNLIFRNLSTGFYCDSDCYSFCTVFSKLPDEFRSRLSQSDLPEELSQIQEADLLPADNFEHRMQLYVQDIYRFHQLFAPYKPLQHYLYADLPEELLGRLLTKPQRTELYEQLADLLLTLKDYDEARIIYHDLLLSEIHAPSALLLQKVGYCHQLLKQYSEAIRWLTKADLAQPDDPWTLRHLAQCYDQHCDPSQALVCYQQLDSLQPDRPELLLRMGVLCMQLHLYDEALPYLHKLYYLQADHPMALSHIARCLLLLQRYEESCSYYDRLLRKAECPADERVAAGAAAALRGDHTTGIRHFTEALEELGDKEFHRTYHQLRTTLKENGIDTSDLDILCNLTMLRL